MSFYQRRAGLIIFGLLATFIALRLYLYVFPNTNLDLFGYNVHHLFSGIVLMVAAGIPLMLWHNHHVWLDMSALLFGAGLAMVLDEWVYLLVTDGSDAAYLLPVSLWGAVSLITVVVCYIGALSSLRSNNKQHKTGH
jgi:hypothetical protein